jgi:hypothetical protein
MNLCHRVHPRTPSAALLILVLMVVPSLVFALTVSPGAIVQGTQSELTISTPGSNWSPGVTVDLGSGLTAGNVQVVNPELLLVGASATVSAPLGTRNIVVQQGGDYVIGTNVLQVLNSGGFAPQGGGSSILDINIVTNPGFEDGDMTGWIPATWSIDTTLPHSGTYDAHDPGASGGGGLCIRQDFSPPIDTNTITSFTFWLRQPDDFGIAQVAVYLQNAGTQYGVAFTNDDDSWTLENFTSLVLPNDYVTAIHVCGFGGGNPDPDDSWADDFDMEAQTGTPVEHTTWGRIKAILR